MDGISLLLKATGFDPEKFQEFIAGMQLYMKKINDDMEAIKADQIKILALLEEREHAAE